MGRCLEGDNPCGGSARIRWFWRSQPSMVASTIKRIVSLSAVLLVWVPVRVATLSGFRASMERVFGRRMWITNRHSGECLRLRFIKQ